MAWIPGRYRFTIDNSSEIEHLGDMPLADDDAATAFGKQVIATAYARFPDLGALDAIAKKLLDSHPGDWRMVLDDLPVAGTLALCNSQEAPSSWSVTT